MSVRFEQAETLLNAIGIYTELAEYDPTFVGTLPIEMDIVGSDVDVICEVSKPLEFVRLVDRCYGDQPGFEISSPDRSKGYVVCRFDCMDFTIEIFGQDKPVKEQNAWRHMEAERKLLIIGGEQAREAIRSLKRGGMKTEPAFAQYFKLEGDPYERLLDFADMPLSQMMSELA